MHPLVIKMHAVARQLTLLLMFSVFLSACAPKKAAVKPSAPTPVIVVAPQDKPAMAELEQSLNSGEYLKAQKLAEGLIKRYPSLASLHINLGVIDLRLNQYEAALEHLEKGLSLNSGYVHGYLFLGETQVALAQYKEAEKSYLKALDINPNEIYAHIGLGVIYDLYLMDFSKAEDHYEAFLEGADGKVDAQEIKKVQTWLKLLKRKRA